MPGKGGGSTGGGRSSSYWRPSSLTNASGSRRRNDEHARSEYAPFRYTTGFGGSRAPTTTSPLANSPRTFLGWLTAGASTLTLAYIPLSAMSTRLDAERAAARPHSQQPTMMSAGRAIWRQDGVRGLFKGGAPHAVKLAPLFLATAVAFAVSSSEAEGVSSRDGRLG